MAKIAISYGVSSQTQVFVDWQEHERSLIPDLQIKGGLQHLWLDISFVNCLASSNLSSSLQALAPIQDDSQLSIGVLPPPGDLGVPVLVQHVLDPSLSNDAIDRARLATSIHVIGSDFKHSTALSSLSPSTIKLICDGASSCNPGNAASACMVSIPSFHDLSPSADLNDLKGKTVNFLRGMTLGKASNNAAELLAIWSAVELTCMILDTTNTASHIGGSVISGIDILTDSRYAIQVLSGQCHLHEHITLIDHIRDSLRKLHAPVQLCWVEAHQASSLNVDVDRLAHSLATELHPKGQVQFSGPSIPVGVMFASMDKAKRIADAATASVDMALVPEDKSVELVLDLDDADGGDVMMTDEDTDLVVPHPSRPNLVSSGPVCAGSTSTSIMPITTTSSSSSQAGAVSARSAPNTSTSKSAVPCSSTSTSSIPSASVATVSSAILSSSSVFSAAGTPSSLAFNRAGGLSNLEYSGPVRFRSAPQAITDRIHDKNAKYHHSAADKGFEFHPFVLDTNGYLPVESIECIRRFAQALAGSSSDSAEVEAMFGRDKPKTALQNMISVLFYKANYKMIVSGFKRIDNSP